MILTRWSSSLLPLAILATLSFAAAQTPGTPAPDDAKAVERALRHATLEWESIAGHLPDPATATPEALTSAADVLRARRLPEDALDYYRFALKRGGDEAKLQNDIGITLLGIERYPEALTAFRRALKLRPKAAQEWNNLGATEYISGNFGAALDDYKRAVKLDKKAAVFHSNLGTAYFQFKDYDSARHQYETAIKLDPDVFHSGGWAGVQAHVLSTSDRGRFCFEMAKMSARLHADQDVILWLGRSAESGFDVAGQMADDKDFESYRKDHRVLMLIQNARALKRGQVADAGAAPPLPAQ